MFIDLANEVQHIEIFDPKIDELFKTIFGSPLHTDITKRFLNDLINLGIEDDFIINFLDKENLYSEYDPNQKRPIVYINIEIKSKQSKINTQNNNQEASSSNSKTAIQQTGQIKRNKDLPTKVLVEMQVFNDSNFFTRIIYNVFKQFTNLYHRGDEFVTKAKIISLNFLYENKFRLKKQDNHKFFHNFNINCKDIDKKYENIEIYIIELARFDIDNFDDKIDKNLWIAFLKCITYELAKFNIQGEEKSYRIPISHLTTEFVEKISRIEEIKKAIDICKKEKPRKYEKFQNLFSVDIKVNELENQIDQLKEENDNLQNENYNLHKEIEELKRKYEGNGNTSNKLQKYTN